MNPSQHTTDIIVAMINNKFISTNDEIATAYKEIYKAVYEPLEK